MIDGFLRVWNTGRDWRPAFAGFEREASEILAAADWPRRMRDRLGLAHYDCAGGPMPVALMRYCVSEVLGAAEAAGASAAASVFTAPTVLDSDPCPYFFPAPKELACGRTMALVPVEGDEDLFAEILHFRIEYRPEHFERIGLIEEPLPDADLRDLRNHHLLAVQVASGRDNFGEGIS